MPRDLPGKIDSDSHGLTLLTFGAGLLFTVLFTVGGAWSMVERCDQIGTGHLPRAALFPVLVFVLLWFLARKGRPAPGGARQQLLFLYCMILAMASIPGQQFGMYFYINMVGPVFYATPQNKHAEIFHHYLPEALLPSKDPNHPAVRYLFEGMPEEMGFFDIPWGAWVAPILVWMPLILGVLFVTLCISVLLRKQWVEHERLLFPLAEVPLTLADQARGDAAKIPLFRRPLFWSCFALPCVWYTLRSFYFYFPEAYPVEPNLRWTTGWLFTESPWYILNNREINIYFDMVGIAYLLASQLGFSLWFFWWWRRFEEMGRTSVGIQDHGEWRYNSLFGGFLMLFLFYLYAGRGHFRNILRNTFGRRDPALDRHEGMSYRFALVGALGGFAVVIAWCTWAGIALQWVLVYWLFYFMLLVIISRIVAEAGVFIFWLPIAPQDFLIRTFGTEQFSAQTRTMLAFVGFNYHDTASHQMPNFLMGLKMGTEARMKLRHVVFAMGAAVLVSVFVCHLSYLWALYETGIPNAGWWWSGASGHTVAHILHQNIIIREPHPRHLGYFLMGGGFTAFLVFMRQRFLWWPFHPLGFVGTPVIDRHWFSIFLGWTLKIIVVQVGGVRLWRRMLPAALGLILGNAFILFIWMCLHYIWPIKGVLQVD